MNFNTISNLQSEIDQIVPVIYVLSEDEHRTILGIETLSQKKLKNPTEIFVYKTTTGFRKIEDYKQEVDLKTYAMDSATADINDAIMFVYKQNKKDRRQIFIITEADQHLEDNQIVRRIRDFAIQGDSSDSNLKILILLSSKLFLPDKLEKYVDVVVYPYPSEEEISQEIKQWVGKFNSATKSPVKKIDINIDFETINALKGLIIPQIHQILTACIDITRKQGNGRLDPTILNELKRKAINKTSILKFRDPRVSFNDVGGLGRLKKWFKTMYGGWTNAGKKFGLPPLKGTILIGLPGCGKSRICEAVASEYKLNLIDFDPSRVFSSRVGESEGNMRMVLSRIDSLSPVILLINEIEKGFAGMQSSSMSDAGTTARTIGIYLQWMDDCDSNVFTVATCNQIRTLPPELISRFDEIFFVGIPDINERQEILEIQIKAVNRDPKNFNIIELAECCNRLSGREIMQVVKEAMYEAFSRLETDKNADLNNEILKQALKRKIPIVKTMEQQLQYLVEWVGYDTERNDGVRARFANNDADEIDKLFAEVLLKSKSSSENQQASSNDIL